MTGSELKAWRERQHMNQTQLAGLLGIHYATIWRWETGARDIPPYLALALETLERNQQRAAATRASQNQPGDQKEAAA
jgi:transcriptional regulator with XRE-family HTH domain